MNEITYAKLAAALDYFKKFDVEIIDKIYIRSKNKKEWPTLGDFRKAVIELGFEYNDEQYLPNLS